MSISEIFYNIKGLGRNTDKEVNSSFIYASNSIENITKKLENKYWGYWDFSSGYENREFFPGYLQIDEEKDIINE